MDRDLSIYEHVKKEEYDIVAGPDWPSYDDFKTHQNIQQLVYDEIDTMLWNLKPFSDLSFCVLPFYAIEYPETVCCRLPKNYNLESIKSDMLAGRRSPYCQQCWTTEDAGLKSDRMVKNETLDFYTNKDIQKLYDQCVTGENSTIHYKIDTSNVCNATCITCGSLDSSAWAQLERKNNLTPKKRSWHLKVDKFADIIDYATARSIGFRGGEPLLSDTNFEILEKLLEKNNSDCFINFTTNGSITLSTSQKKLLSKFKNVNFGFSLDGIGPVFEYLRYPLEWNKILENIDFCRKNNILVSVHHTVSNLNIFYHRQMVSWLKDNNINYMCSLVEHPSYFRPAALPAHVKKLIIEQQLAPEMNFLLTKHTAKDQQDYEAFRKDIARQDAWKAIRMEDYLPELIKVLG